MALQNHNIYRNWHERPLNVQAYKSIIKVRGGNIRTEESFSEVCYCSFEKLFLFFLSGKKW